MVQVLMASSSEGLLAAEQRTETAAVKGDSQQALELVASNSVTVV
jgi:hypothetical protein